MGNPTNPRLQLLGRLRLQGDGEGASPVRISARKGLALLAYLAVRPERSASRSHLATLLWADRTDKLARHSLRQCLTSLRADLADVAPDLLQLSDDMVELRLPDGSVDACEFEGLAGSAELADLTRAAELYRGPFLADFDLGVETFDDWARAERARFEAVAAQVLAACAVGFDRRGEGNQALEAGERLVALDPLREDWQCLMLQLTARHRGRDAALARADVFAGLLRSELGVAPPPSSAALIDDIRQSAAVRAPIVAAPSPVPAALAVEATRRRPLLAALSLSVALVLGVGLSLWWSTSPVRAPLAAGGFAAVVVLPFKGDGAVQDSALASRFTGELIDELSHAPSMRVISQQTSNLYRGKATDVSALRADLGVRYVVDGRIQQQDGIIRISTALIDSESRLQLWSDRSDLAASDGLAVPGETTRGLARALYMRMVAAEGRRATQQDDPGIEGLLAQGWAAIHRHNATSTTGTATAAFEEVLRRQPHNVTALIGLGAADVAAVSDLTVAQQEPHLTHAEAVLNQALAQDPESPGAHYWLGVVQKIRGQFDEALQSFEASIRFSPSFAPAYAQAGHVQAQRGQVEQGLARIAYAIALNPQDSAVGRWYLFAGQIELERDHLEAAMDNLTRAVGRMPRNVRVRAALASAYALAGRMDDAARQIVEIRKLAPAQLDGPANWSLLPLNGSSQASAPRLCEGWRRALAAS